MDIYVDGKFAIVAKIATDYAWEIDDWTGAYVIFYQKSENRYLRFFFEDFTWMVYGNDGNVTLIDSNIVDFIEDLMFGIEYLGMFGEE